MQNKYIKNAKKNIWIILYNWEYNLSEFIVFIVVYLLQRLLHRF